MFLSAPTPRPCRAAAVLAAAAARCGHDVHWAGKRHYAFLQNVGVTFRPLEADVDLDVSSNGRSFGTNAERVADLAEALFAPSCRIVREAAPDLVVCDTDAVWGAVSAESQRTPLASYSSGLFVASPDRIRFLEEAVLPSSAVNWCRRPCTPDDDRLCAERRLNRLRESLGLPATMNLDRVLGDVHLVFTTRFFEFAGARLPDSVRCIGPMFRWAGYADLDGSTRPFNADGGERHLLFVHWPSSVPDAPARLERIHAAAQGTGLSVVVETDLPDSDIPAGARRAISSVAHPAILRAASAVVCSGDFDAVQEALSWGVPTLVIPCTSRDWAVGLRVEELGLGCAIEPARLESDTMRTALNAILRDASIGVRVGEFALEARMTDAAGRGVRLLEALVATGAAPPPMHGRQAARLPQYPRFARHVRCLSSPGGGLSIGSYLEQFEVADEDAARALAWVWTTLDGTVSVGDAIDAWQGDGDVLHLLEWLAQRGLLEEGSGHDRISSEDGSRYASQISLFAHAAGAGVEHPRLGGPVFQEKLLNAKVGVFGAGVLGSSVVRHLALVGVGELHIAGQGTVDDPLIDSGSWFEPADAGCERLDALAHRLRALRPQTRVVACRDNEMRLEELDLVVVAEDAVDPRQLRQIGSRCHEAPVAWTSVRPERWDVEIGPTVIPGRTACFECYEARRLGALAADPNRRPQSVPIDAGHLNIPLGADLVVVEAVKLLTGFGDVASVGHVLVLSPMQMALTSHFVVRLPSCRRCSGNMRPGTESVWRDDVNA